MGFIYVELGVANPATPETSEKVRALVDTGATLSVFPASLLERLGVERVGSKQFRGFGGVVTREIGVVSVRYDSAVAGVTAIFGDEDDPAIMGVTALESLGFDVDPVAGRLKSVEMLML